VLDLSPMEPSQAKPDPRAEESAVARAEDAHAGPVLGYAARPAGARRLWRWIRPGSVLFFVLIAWLAAGAGWGAWKWRLAADREAFEACATINSYSAPGVTGVSFTHAPSRGALRHLSRLPGPFYVTMQWPESENAAAAQAIGAADLGNVSEIWIRGDTVNADLLLKELSRPDSGLKALTRLSLSGENITDAGLKELARPDSGFKALTRLNLYGEKVTDAGLKELCGHDNGLRALTWLDLAGTKVTDAGLKELARPDSGLKALTTLDLFRTTVTHAGVKALKAARPGLTVVY